MSTLEADLERMSSRIITHMNADHADSLLAYAVYFAGLTDARSAKMSGVNTTGFELDVTLASGTVKKGVLIEYTSPLRSAGEVRKLAVSMHFAAYNGLGLGFKLRNNFYGNAVRQAWTHMPAKIKYPAAAILFGTLAACAKLMRRLLR